jgi:hypothetical protein
VYITSNQQTLTKASSIPFIASHHIPFWPVLTLSSNLISLSSGWSHPIRYSNHNSVRISHLTMHPTCPAQSHNPWFDHPDDGKEYKTKHDSVSLFLRGIFWDGTRRDVVPKALFSEERKPERRTETLFSWNRFFDVSHVLLPYRSCYIQTSIFVQFLKEKLLPSLTEFWVTV